MTAPGSPWKVSAPLPSQSVPPRWILARTGEAVSTERGSEWARRYHNHCQWESIFSNRFWCVQRLQLPTSEGEGSDDLDLYDYEPRPLSVLCTCQSVDCVLCLEKEMPFRIISNCSDRTLIVSLAHSSAEILDDRLQFLHENVSDPLQLIDTDPRDDDALMNFITLKMCALIERQALTSSPSPQLSENNSFELLRIFHPEVRDDDVRYRGHCAVWQHRYFKGSLFVTGSHLYFISLSHQFQLCITLTNLVDFHQEEIKEFQQPGILLSPYELYIFELGDIREALQSLQSTWHSAMKTVLLRYEQTSRRHLSTNRHASFDVIYEWEAPGSPSRGGESSLSAEGHTTTFHSNPYRPMLTADQCVLSFYSEDDLHPVVRNMTGSIVFSLRGAQFKSPQHQISMILPYLEIRSIAREGRALTMHLRLPQSYRVRIEGMKDRNIVVLQQLYFLQKLTNPTVDVHGLLRESPSHGIFSPLRAKSSPLMGLSWLRRSPTGILQEQWRQHFRMSGSGPTLIRSPELARLIRSGVPDLYRTYIWRFLCGSMYAESKEIGDFDYYLHDCPRASFISNEIERDLDRTLPTHTFFKPGTGSKICSLRHVLLAYSRKNSSVGYCQGMNVVVAYLLMYLDEESAFDCFSHISESIVPGYFQQSLSGIKRDQRVMDVLLERYLPAVSAHLQRQIGGCILICFEWFICFFGRCLPTEMVLRIFDWLLLDESRALFIAALAIFSHFEKLILDSPVAPTIIENLKSGMTNISQPEAIFQAMFHFETLVTDNEINQIRLSDDDECGNSDL